MLYIKLPDTYPYRIERFRADHPGTSFPAELTDDHYADFGVHRVAETPAPDYDPAAHGLDTSATLIDGQWVQSWTVRPATQDEIDAHAEKLKLADDKAAKESARADATIRFLSTATDAQIEAKIQKEITTLAQAKVMIGRLAVAVGALCREILK